MKKNFLTELLPRLKPAQPLYLSNDEVFIQAAGFEDRTLAFKDYIFSQHESFSLILDYKPYDNRNKLLEIKELLNQNGFGSHNSKVLIYDRFEPNNFESELSDYLMHIKISRAVIDISSLSKLAIILILNVCKNQDLQVTLLYAEAKFYSPTKKQFFDAKKELKIHQPSLKVFNGIHGVVRVNSIASVSMQGQPTAAIVFMSLNDALTQVLLNTVYPSRLLLINGKPPLMKWREAATAWIHEQVRHEWESDNPLYYNKSHKSHLPKRAVSTLDYRESFSLLLELYWALSVNHRIILAPSGSKMQAIGCFLMKALHPDIHIEYPSPEGFFSDYSRKIGRVWTLKIGFINKLILELTKLEQPEYIEL